MKEIREPLRSSEGVQRLLPRIREGGRLRVEGGPGLGKTEVMLRLAQTLESDRELVIGLCLLTGAGQPPVMPVLGALGEALGRALGRSGLGVDALLERLPGSLWPQARALLRVMLALGAEQGHGLPGSRVRMREVGEALVGVAKRWTEQPEQQAWLTRRVMMSAWQELFPRLGKFRWLLLVDGLERASERTAALIDVLLGLPEAVLGAVVGVDPSAETDPEAASPRDSSGGADPRSPSSLGRRSGPVWTLPAIHLLPWSWQALQVLWQSQRGGESPGARALVAQTGGVPGALMYGWAERRLLGGPGGALEATARAVLGVLCLSPAPLGLEPGVWLELLDATSADFRGAVELLEQVGEVLLLPGGILLRHAHRRTFWLENLSSALLLLQAEKLERVLQIHHSRDLTLGCVMPQLEALVAVLETLQRRSQAFRVRAQLAESWLQWGGNRRALFHLQALAVAEEAGGSGRNPSALGRILHLQGVALLHLGRPEQAILVLERSLLLLRQAGELGSAWAGVINVLRAHLDAGQAERVRALFQDFLLEVAGQAEELVWQAWWLLGLAELQLGNTAQAVEAWQQAVQAGDVWGVSPQLSRMHAELGVLLMRQERIAEGTAHLSEAVSRFLREGRRPAAALNAARLAAVSEVMGHLPDAHRAWQQALDAVVEDGQGTETWCTLSAGYAGFLLRTGAWEAGIEILQRALERAQEEGYPAAELRLLEEGAAAYDQADRPELAVGYARACVRLARQEGVPAGLGRALNTLGILLYRLGSGLEARTCFEEGLEVLRDAGDPGAETVLQHNLGVALGAVDALEEGVIQLRSAAAHRLRQGDLEGAKASKGAAIRMLEALEDYRGAAGLLRELLETVAVPGTLEAGQLERHLADLTAVRGARRPGR